MNCPACGAAKDRVKVLDSRPSDRGTCIKRRRECQECGHRFNTVESLDARRAKIVKRDGCHENFDDQKLRASLERVLAKRPVSEEQIDELVKSVQYRVLSIRRDEVKSSDIARFVMRRLAVLDETAYVRYASHYRQFRATGVPARPDAAEADARQIDLFEAPEPDED